jgi:hypothetical protein
MKNILFLFLIVGLVCPILCIAQTDFRENQLTGIFHEAKGKSGAYLEMDGPGEFHKIELMGAPLKGIPDGSRIWVKGQIKSWEQGSDNPQAQQPRHWSIVMIVERCRPIQAPFEVPNLKIQ